MYFFFSFGAGFASPQTGIILNNVMDDFSNMFKNYFELPGSRANMIAPGKRPVSSMSPVIITDANGDVRMVIGASGGTKIISAVAYVSKGVLFLLYINIVGSHII